MIDSFFEYRHQRKNQCMCTPEIHTSEIKDCPTGTTYAYFTFSSSMKLRGAPLSLLILKWVSSAFLKRFSCRSPLRKSRLSSLRWNAMHFSMYPFSPGSAGSSQFASCGKYSFHSWTAAPNDSSKHRGFFRHLTFRSESRSSRLPFESGGTHIAQVFQWWT